MSAKQHSFGGSRLDRHVFDFDPTVLPAGDVNIGNFREGSAAPYAEALDRLGLGDAPAAPAAVAPAPAGTPIELALAQDPYAAPAPAAPSPVAAPAPVAPAAPAAPAASTDPYAAPAPAAPAAEAIPSWATELQETVAVLSRALAPSYAPAAPAAPAAPVAPAGPEINFDTASSEEIRSFLNEQLQAARTEATESAVAAIQEQLAPFMPLLGNVAQTTAMDAAREHFKGLESNVGRFNHDEAYVRARAIMADYPQADPENVLKVAAEQQHEFEKTLWQEFATMRGQTAGNVASAPPAVPAAPAAASEIQAVPTGPDRYEIARRDFFARRTAQPAPIGA